MRIVDSLRDEIDGVGVLYSPATVSVAQEIVAQLQSGAPAGPAAAPPTPGATATVLPEIAATLAPTPTSAPLPAAKPPATLCTAPAGLLLAGGGLAGWMARRRRSGGLG